MKFTPGWYLIYTKPRHEKKVADQLKEQGTNYLLPVQKRLSHWHDRKKMIEAPLFPSYVFVELKELQKYFSILQMAGLICFVRFGNQIAIVPDDVIERLRIVTGSSDVIVTSEHFQPGTHVVISEGPMQGLNCEVVNYRNTNMVIVRLNLLKRSILASVPASKIVSQSTYQL